MDISFFIAQKMKINQSNRLNGNGGGSMTILVIWQTPRLSTKFTSTEVTARSKLWNFLFHFLIIIEKEKRGMCWSKRAIKIGLWLWISTVRSWHNAQINGHQNPHGSHLTSTHLSLHAPSTRGENFCLNFNNEIGGVGPTKEARVPNSTTSLLLFRVIKKNGPKFDHLKTKN